MTYNSYMWMSWYLRTSVHYSLQRADRSQKSGCSSGSGTRRKRRAARQPLNRVRRAPRRTLTHQSIYAMWTLWTRFSHCYYICDALSCDFINLSIHTDICRHSSRESFGTLWTRFARIRRPPETASLAPVRARRRFAVNFRSFRRYF